jgi:ABC-type oligopeptide transport system ATPase subunit
VRAVDGISFTIPPGKTLGVVGESGCGKTTTAKLVLLLEEPTGGSIRFLGKELGGLGGVNLRDYRKSVQAVFQDPFASLNPRMRVGTIIAEPLITNEALEAPEVKRRIRNLLELVGLPDRAADLFPHEFSGGQRQRIAIARALAVSPSSSCWTSRSRRSTSRSGRRSSTCSATFKPSSACPTSSSPTTSPPSRT